MKYKTNNAPATWEAAYEKWGEGNWGCGDKAAIQQEAFEGGYRYGAEAAEAGVKVLEEMLTRIAGNCPCSLASDCHGAEARELAHAALHGPKWYKQEALAAKAKP